MIQYVDIKGREPARRHVFREFLSKRRGEPKQGITACGSKFPAEGAIVLAFPDTEVNGQPAPKLCPACIGDGVDAEAVTASAEASAIDDGALERPARPMPVYRMIAPGAIAPSPFNHRKTFTGIDELAASLVEKGMISPITVRPHDSRTPEAKTHELVVGERRWRAAQIAKLSAIPCIVRELTDREVLEIQLVENIQRVDVHPLEEADGYRELLDKHGLDVDEIASRTGKSKATIYARLKLCALAPGPRKAFLDDKLNASIALLIARIPEKLQEQATKEVLGQVVDSRSYDPSDPLNEERRELIVDLDGKRSPERQPMSVREAQVHIQRRYMLRLELAKFPIDDAELVPKAGACTTCPKRTGNQRELFADVRSADVCTDPPCFEAKSKAAFERRAREAAAEGAKVIPADKAVKIFDDGGEVMASSPYVDPKASIPWSIKGYDGKEKSWEQMLGKKLAADVPKVIVQNPDTGAPYELIDKRAAIEKLREAGKIDKPERSSGSGVKPTDWEKQRAADEKKRRINDAATKEATRAAMEAANRLDPKKELAWWRWVARELIEYSQQVCIELTLGYEPDYAVGKARKWPEEVVAKLDTVAKARAFVTGALFERAAPGAFQANPSESFVLGAKLLGVDWAKHLEAAKKNVKEAERAEEAAAKAKEKQAKASAKKGRK